MRTTNGGWLDDGMTGLPELSELSSDRVIRLSRAGDHRSVRMPNRAGTERSRMSPEICVRKKSETPAAQEGSPTSMQATRVREMRRTPNGRRLDDLITGRPDRPGPLSNPVIG